MTTKRLENDRPSSGRARGGTSNFTPAKKAVNRIALARAISFAGGNAAFIALLFVLYRETDSAGVVSLGALACFAVPALASPVAGWLGDRFDRRKVMVTSELIGAVLFLLSAAVSSAPVELLLLRVLASLAAAPLMSAGAAALPKIVGDQMRLAEANERLAAAGIFGAVVGAPIAAGLMAVSGATEVFLFNAITFVVSAIVLLTIKADFRPTRSEKEKGALAELAAGFQYIGHHRILRPVTLAYAVIFIGVGLTAPAEVALSTDFDAGATGFAALTCAFALGGITGARFAGRGLLPSLEPTAILAAASGALAVGFLVVGFAPAFAVVLVGMAVAGTADGVWIVAHENLVQRVTPDSIRSRVFAGGEAVYQGGIAVGTIGAGALIGAFGAARTFQLGAVGSILACVLLALTAIAVGKTSLGVAVSRPGGLAAPPTAAVLASPAGKASPVQTAEHPTQ